MGCHALLQAIFSTQGRKPHLSLSLALAGRIFTARATWKAPVNTDNQEMQKTRTAPNLNWKSSKYRL